MTLQWNLIIQFLFLFMQGLGPLFAGTGKWEIVYASFMAASQGIVAVLAHHYTPDGAKIPAAVGKGDAGA